jgi:hypothetical protein
MSYLAKAALCSTLGSIGGNFMGRPAHIPLLIHLALKGLLPSRSVGTSIEDPNNPGVSKIKLTTYPAYDPHGHNEKKIHDDTEWDNSSDKNDIYAIGICAVAPLLISGFLNPTLRNSDEFHFTMSFGMSALASCVLRLFREEPTKKNNKPNDNDDKPSKKKSEPPAITRLSETDKRILKEYKEPDPERLSLINKTYYKYLKNELNTTQDKAEILKIKIELDKMAKEQEKEQGQGKINIR